MNHTKLAPTPAKARRKPNVSFAFHGLLKIELPRVPDGYQSPQTRHFVAFPRSRTTQRHINSTVPVQLKQNSAGVVVAFQCLGP